MNKFDGYGVLHGSFKKFGTYRVDQHKEIFDVMSAVYKG